MPTCNLVLTAHQELFIGEPGHSGRRGDASEVLSKRVRPMSQRESVEAVELDSLRGRSMTYAPGLFGRAKSDFSRRSSRPACPFARPPCRTTDRELPRSRAR